MKRVPEAIGNLLVALSVFAAYGRAQVASFRVRIPFDFVTGHATLPAGNYVFQRLLGKPTKQDTLGIIVLRNTEKKIYRAIVTSLAAPPSGFRPSDAKIIFRRFQGRHYLERVWVSGDHLVHVLTVPPGLEPTLDPNTTDVITMDRLR